MMTLRTQEGIVFVNPADILDIRYDEMPVKTDWDALRLYRQRSVEVAHDDLEERMNLAKFCLTSGLYEQAAQEFRALLPYFPRETDELRSLIRKSEEAAFNAILSEIAWHSRIARREQKAYAMIQNLRARFPDLSRREAARKVIASVEQEIISRRHRERLKAGMFVHATPNFRVYSADGSKAAIAAFLCEALRVRLRQVLSLSPAERWQPACDVMLFKDHDDFILASGAEEWSSATTLLSFELDQQRLPVVYERAILAYASSPAETRAIMSHEMIHLLFQELIGVTSKIPPWVSEGLASVLLHEGNGPQPSPQAHPIPLRTLARLENYPPFQREFYEQSAKLVDFLIKTGGLDRFLSLSFLLGNGTSLEPALRQTYPEQIEAIQKLLEHLEEEE